MLDLVSDFQSHPCVAARSRNEGLIGWRSSAREEHVGLIDEGFPRDPLVVRKPVPTWERDDQTLRQEALTHERVARDRRSKNPDMDGAVLEGGDLLWSREI